MGYGQRVERRKQKVDPADRRLLFGNPVYFPPARRLLLPLGAGVQGQEMLTQNDTQTELYANIEPLQGTCGKRTAKKSPRGGRVGRLRAGFNAGAVSGVWDGAAEVNLSSTANMEGSETSAHSEQSRDDCRGAYGSFVYDCGVRYGR